MKKIINGKMYNTETAREISYWSNNHFTSDFNYCEETLYRKKTGEFFILGEGGGMSKYAKMYDTNSWGWGEEIIPMSAGEAKKWLEQKGGAEEYISVFGEPEE